MGKKVQLVISLFKRRTRTILAQPIRAILVARLSVGHFQQPNRSVLLILLLFHHVDQFLFSFVYFDLF